VPAVALMAAKKFLQPHYFLREFIDCHIRIWKATILTQWVTSMWFNTKKIIQLSMNSYIILY